MAYGYGHGYGYARGEPGTGTPGSGGSAWIPSGAAWAYDFENDRYWDGTTEYLGFSSATAGSAASFLRASSGFYEATSGAVSAFASGELRLGDRGALVEIGSTNRLVRNDNLLDASWSSAGVAASGTTATAPDGTTVDGITIGDGYIFQQPAGPSGSVLNINSAWIKAESGTAHMGFRRGGSSGTFNVSINVTDTWQRFEASLVLTSNPRWLLDNRANGGYSGVPTQVYIWMAGQEHGPPAATSPIATASAAATRVADALTVIPPDGSYDITIVYDDDSTDLLAAEAVSGGWAVDPATLSRPYVKMIWGA